MKDNNYVNPVNIKKILSDRSKINYDNLVQYILNIRVNLSIDEIKNYLDNRFEIENKFLKDKINNYNYKYSGEKYIDLYNARKYIFDDVTYKYFVNYIDILKNKIFKLLQIIEWLIINKNGNLDNNKNLLNILNDLDIILVNNNIHVNDIDRLIIPIIDNFNKLMELNYLANNLDTYFDYYVNSDYLLRNQIDFDCLFPNKDLQIIYGRYGDYKGYVPWSTRQKIKK